MSSLSVMFDNMPTKPNRAALGAAFDGADAYSPIPAGEYVARWISGKLGETRMGKPCFIVHFEVTSGEYAGRRLVHRWFLTPSAMSYSRRDLEPFGFTLFVHLESGKVPSGLVRLRVVVNADKYGKEFNEVRSALPCQYEPLPNEAMPAPTAPNCEPQPQPLASARVEDLPAGLVDPEML